MGIWFFYPLSDTWAREQGFVKATIRQMAAKYGLRKVTYITIVSLNLHDLYLKKQDLQKEVAIK